MKLYYAPGACSLSPHIVTREAGIAVELEKVDLKAKKTASGEDYLRVNPKGYVPAMRLDDGSVLTEGPAIVQYLVDQKPDSGVAPNAGSKERYKLVEWLAFLNSEVHKTWSGLWKPDADRPPIEEKLGQRLGWLDGELKNRPFLMGERFSAYAERVKGRPAVRASLRAEGL